MFAPTLGLTIGFSFGAVFADMWFTTTSTVGGTVVATIVVVATTLNLTAVVVVVVATIVSSYIAAVIALTTLVPLNITTFVHLFKYFPGPKVAVFEESFHCRLCSDLFPMHLESDLLPCQSFCLLYNPYRWLWVSP